MSNLLPKGLYAITSNNDSLMAVQAVLQAGTAVLQYREKLKPNIVHARSLKRLCDQNNAVLIINDNPELARAVNADGVHLGEDDESLEQVREILGEDSIIGVSCYDSLGLAIEAEQRGANYVAFGAFFPSKTKQNTRRPDLDLLRKAKKKLSIPIVAIGGITPENASPLITAGADYIAAIHGVFGQSDPSKAAKQYKELFEE
ncbi:MAG: thiamine phosphate synthase [Gammaproteobacteria bacterium]